MCPTPLRAEGLRSASTPPALRKVAQRVLRCLCNLGKRIGTLHDGKGTSSESPVPSREQEFRWSRMELTCDQRTGSNVTPVLPSQDRNTRGQAITRPLCAAAGSGGCRLLRALIFLGILRGPFEEGSTAGWEVGMGRWGPSRDGDGSGMRPPSRWPLCALPGPPAVPYLHYINNGLNALINTC